MAKIGLWSDCHNFPSLPLMKLSAYHKNLGDNVEMLNHLEHYDLAYCSKTFSFTPDAEDAGIIQADEIRKGGTGYCISTVDGKEVFEKSKDIGLPKEIEHIYPDYSLYPNYDYAVGFLTRGCPRGCQFCIVGEKEGRCSQQVAEISEFWRGQKEIKLLDPNLLASREHEVILQQLIHIGARIDFTQGLDIRLTNPDNIQLLNKINTKRLHFAWDNPKQDLTGYFKRFSEYSTVTSYNKKVVYVLTNYNSSIDEDLYRIYTLRDLGYNPYVMVYQKEKADKIHKNLQRWVNCRQIFRTVDNFENYMKQLNVSLDWLCGNDI